MALGLLALPNAVKAAQATYASPAIDNTLFAPGAVQRVQENFKGWNMVCDQIARLHQRFCSLRSTSFDSHGIAVAKWIISTSDSGKPAALITLAYGVYLPAPLTIWLTSPEGPPRAIAHLDAASCTADGCKIVWALAPAIIMALRRSWNLDCSFIAASTPEYFPGPRDFHKVKVFGRLAGQGFDAALLASLK